MLALCVFTQRQHLQFSNYRYRLPYPNFETLPMGQGKNVLQKVDWNKGYGSEAISLLIDYAFNSLNLHNIRLNVYESNVNAISCYSKLGFQRVGIVREAVFMNQKYENLVIMDLLPNDFYNKKA